MINKVFQWFNESYGWQDSIPVTLELGHSKLLVITGENASGKSLLRRILQSLAIQDKIESISTSPELRQMGGVGNAFIYGDESYEASGKIMAGMVLGAIRTSQKRNNPHIIILDEPDMGLSDNAAAGVGEEIVDFCNNPAHHLVLFVVITHRKAMLESFLRAKASHIRVGDTMSLEAVVKQPLIPLRPKVLVERAHKMFIEVGKLLKS